MDRVQILYDKQQGKALFVEPSQVTTQALAEIQSGNLVEQSLAERVACIYGPFSRNAKRLIKQDRARLVASGLEDLDPKLFLVTRIFLRNEKRILKHLTPREKYFLYDTMKKLSNPKLIIPESGHPLDDLCFLLNGLPVEYAQNLAGFRSFRCSRFSNEENKKNINKPLIICLYKKALGKLLLANIGEHNKVYDTTQK